MREYRQLTDEDRVEIYAMKQAGKEQNNIAVKLGVHPSTISRELVRNAGLRGLNENTNGLIRQYVPKGSNIRVLTNERLQHIMNRLNNRPRKSLDFLTPNEVFYDRKKLTG